MTAETRLPWDGEAERILKMLLEMVPQTVRPLAEASARDESELVAQDRGAEEVGGEDVVRGWIRTTPPEQRNGLVAVIESLGYEPETFSDELESAEGWPEEEG
jgi:hypothetical protein